jgi:flagellar L-ring protein precursor FlgH
VADGSAVAAANNKSRGATACGFWTALALHGALLVAAGLPPHALAQPSSLYDAQEFEALVTDNRARQIGDSLVVLVYESATATNRANTTVNKSTNIEVGASDGYNTVGGSLNTANDANGGGVERRSGEVLARVSATVVDINARGEYLIQGKQHIALNNESQVITVEGRVRPQDIDTNNAVLSTRIADAKIEFIGQGLLSSREQPGIFTRIFNWLF